MKCRNCGGEMEREAPACPFCGALNAEGAEKSFMGKLYDMEEELGEGEHRPTTVMKKTTWSSFLIFGGMMVVAAMLITAVNLAVWRLEEYQERAYEKEAYARILWRDEHYEELDRLYEEDDIEGILNYMEEIEAVNAYSFYDWQHFVVAEAWQVEWSCREAVEKLHSLTEGQEVDYSVESAAASAFDLAIYQPEEWKKRASDEKDLAWVEQCQHSARLFLTEELRLTEQEIEEIKREAEQAGYVGTGIFEEYLEGWNNGM